MEIFGRPRLGRERRIVRWRSQRHMQFGGAAAEGGGGIEIDADDDREPVETPDARTAPADRRFPRLRFRETSEARRFRSSDRVLRLSISSRRPRSPPSLAAWQASVASEPLVADSSSMEPAKGGMRSNFVFSVRYRPISTSGLIPGSRRRNSFRMRRSPKMIEVLLCSAEPRLYGQRPAADPRICLEGPAWKSSNEPFARA